MDKKEIDLLFNMLNKINEKLDKLLEKENKNTTFEVDPLCYHCTKYIKECNGVLKGTLQKDKICGNFIPRDDTNVKIQGEKEHDICAITLEKCDKDDCTTCPHGKKGSTKYA